VVLQDVADGPIRRSDAAAALQASGASNYRSIGEFPARLLLSSLAASVSMFNFTSPFVSRHVEALDR